MGSMESRSFTRQVLSALHACFERQVAAHERIMLGVAVSGQDALSGDRQLRWDGRRLVGDLLPPKH